jgi:hypothetical protein
VALEVARLPDLALPLLKLLLAATNVVTTHSPSSANDLRIQPTAAVPQSAGVHYGFYAFMGAASSRSLATSRERDRQEPHLKPAATMTSYWRSAQ